MNLKGKKILVTGGGGFIGFHLTKRLNNLGAKVSIFDIENGDDIEDFVKVEGIIKKKFDIIYHLAGFSGSEKSNRQPILCFRVNAFATVNLCKLIVDFSPKTKLVISSSRLEYGQPRYLPVDENHPVLPTSAYGLSKLTATQVALLYHKKYGLDATIFRSSNVYGPHHGESFSGYNLVNFFTDQAKKGSLLTVFGKGDQLRDYLYIDDLVEAFVLAQNKTSKGKIYNLGYGVGIKFLDMAKLIIKKARKGKIKFVKWPHNYEVVETGSYVSDISKIEKELKFKPKVSFAEGIEKTLRPLS